MKTCYKFGLLALLSVALLPLTAVADDLNSPDYRGDPLSVYAHWIGQAGSPMDLVEFGWIDDQDPDTFLWPDMPPSYERTDESNYIFMIPNVVDDLPLKLLRMQLTWTGTTEPPIGIDAIGEDVTGGTGIVPGNVTFASPPLVFTQPDGGYQYFDFEFRPNPDYENIHVHLPPGAELVQVVVDSISIIPEPSTFALLVLGGLVLARKFRRTS